MQGAAVGHVEDVQAVVDGQHGELVVVAPQDEGLGLGGRAARAGVVAGQDEAVQPFEKIVPAADAALGQADGLGLGGDDGGGQAGRPQAAAVPLLGAGQVGTEDADADGGGLGRHERSPFLG